MNISCCQCWSILQPLLITNLQCGLSPQLLPLFRPPYFLQEKRRSRLDVNHQKCNEWNSLSPSVPLSQVFEREQLVVVTPGRIICVRAYPFKQSVFQFLLIPDACSGPLTPFEEQKWMHSVVPGKSVHHSASLGHGTYGTSEVSITPVASCGYSRWDMMGLLSMIFVSCFRFMYLHGISQPAT